MRKHILLIIIALLCVSNAMAQTKNSYITIKFVDHKDELFVPYSSNTKNLKQIKLLVAKMKVVPNGSIRINGYCAVDSTGKTNLKLASIRANRVKSEIMSFSNKVTEKSFYTKNSNSPLKGQKNIVLVTIPDVKEGNDVPTKKYAVQSQGEVITQNIAYSQNFQVKPAADTTNSYLDKIVQTTNGFENIDIMNNTKTPFKTINNRDVVTRPQSSFNTEGNSTKSDENIRKLKSMYESSKRAPKFAPAAPKFALNQPVEARSTQIVQAEHTTHVQPTQAQAPQEPTPQKPVVSKSKIDYTLEPVKEQPTSTTSKANSYYSPKSEFSLKANLLKWLTLTPDIGLEWKYDRFSLSVNAGTTFGVLQFSDDMIWGQWYVKPQFKVYIGPRHRWYVGAGYNYGESNYKFSETGRQGIHQTASILAGYKLPITNSLSLDFNIGAGYINWDFEDYICEQGKFISTVSGVKEAINITDLGVTLVWKFK